MKKLQIAICAASLAVAMNASANLTYSDTVTVAPSSSGFSGLTFALPTFDSSLGILNSVVLTLTPTLGDFGSEAINFTSSPIPVTSATEAISGTGLLNNSALGMTATYVSTSGTLTSPNYTAAAGFLVVTEGPGLPFTWTIVDSSADVTAAGYTGLGGSLAFTGTSPSFTSSGSVPGGAIGGYGNVGGSLNVAFDYTPVPEPAPIISGALLLLPFGVGVVRKLCKRHNA